MNDLKKIFPQAFEATSTENWTVTGKSDEGMSASYYVIDCKQPWKKFFSPASGIDDAKSEADLNPFNNLTDEKAKLLLSQANWQLIINNQKGT